jgi:hypothetical protein
MSMDAASCGAALGAGFAQRRYQQQFAGDPYQQSVPLPPHSRPGWSIILNVDPGASKEDITRVYHVLAMLNHPDHGGSNEAMASINKAYELAMKSR